MRLFKGSNIFIITKADELEKFLNYSFPIITVGVS